MSPGEQIHQCVQEEQDPASTNLDTMDLACHEGWIPLATVNPVALKIGFQPSRTPYVFYTLHVFFKKR